jgi:hypothetical protein
MTRGGERGEGNGHLAKGAAAAPGLFNKLRQPPAASGGPLGPIGLDFVRGAFHPQGKSALGPLS